MKVFLDACVLFPSVMRDMLIGAAKAGFYDPLWSPRVLEEWARAARRFDQEATARIEIALLCDEWKSAMIEPRLSDLKRLVLPDDDDVHVLAAAIAGSAEILVTLNAKDFPRHTLNEEGLSRQDPDGFLHAFWREDPSAMAGVADHVYDAALAMPDPPENRSKLLKKAGLYRLAKALRQ